MDEHLEEIEEDFGAELNQPVPVEVVPSSEPKVSLCPISVLFSFSLLFSFFLNFRNFFLDRIIFCFTNALAQC